MWLLLALLYIVVSVVITALVMGLCDADIFDATDLKAYAFLFVAWPLVILGVIIIVAFKMLRYASAFMAGYIIHLFKNKR